MTNKFIAVTKPGIIFGNAVTVAGGFFLAAQGEIKLWLFLATLSGIGLIIASGCVFNNIIDRDIDKLMERTRARVLATGSLSLSVAAAYATALGLLGVLLLMWQTNFLTVSIALVGWLVYVVIYSLWLKRGSLYGTLIGSISGAVPPVVGYCAVTNHFDSAALILFIILCLWQMPHSYAIAIFRYSDYAAAKIPVLPLIKGIARAKYHMLIYVVAYLISTLLLYFAGYSGVFYLAGALLSGLLWLRLAIRGFSLANNQQWARKMFGFSILSITLLSLLMAIDFVPQPGAKRIMLPLKGNIHQYQ